MDDKTKSIVAHITIIGWIIALVMNQSDKGPNTSFYLRQLLGLWVIGLFGWLVSMVSPILAMVFYLLILVLWVLSLVGALSGEQKPLPVVGAMFQQWFKS
ncbi:MAG: YtxH domain-containing protein, partial [Saprospiraceae bacterium]